MTTKTETMNSYKITFVFDYTTISTCIFAMNEDAAIDMAADYIYDDLGYSNLSSILNGAQDITVELLDEDVL
jgi:hypothetical protein